jgi:hypothetical protein
MSWLDLQQKLLNDFANQKSESPFCNHGASPRGGRIPKEYCNCGDDTRKTLTYSVASSTASPYEPCPYTTNNGPTVTFQPESTATPSATPVVACAPKQDRWFSSSDAFNWIHDFCNHPDGRLLKLRPATGDLIDAQSQVFNNNQDPYIRIYAYLEDACREKKTMDMNKQECVKALDTIMHECEFFLFLFLFWRVEVQEGMDMDMLTRNDRRSGYRGEEDGWLRGDKLSMVQYCSDQGAWKSYL